jgi:hypothetical protein
VHGPRLGKRPKYQSLTPSHSLIVDTQPPERTFRLEQNLMKINVGRPLVKMSTY